MSEQTMSDQTLSANVNVPPSLPRRSSAALVILYFLVLPWSVLGALMLVSGPENDMELSLARERPAESISAGELATHLRPPGTHVALSDYSMKVRLTLGGDRTRVQREDVQVNPVPEIESGSPSSLIYATLSPATAANVVNSGDIVVPGGPLIPKSRGVTLLDAVIVSSDAHYVRIIDTSIAETPSTITFHRILAGLLLLVGITALFAIFKLHRHRRTEARNALAH